jgi:hypothetical protein
MDCPATVIPPGKINDRRIGGQGKILKRTGERLLLLIRVSTGGWRLKLGKTGRKRKALTRA